MRARMADVPGAQGLQLVLPRFGAMLLLAQAVQTVLPAATE
jgi:hypothetical protein